MKGSPVSSATGYPLVTRHNYNNSVFYFPSRYSSNGPNPSFSKTSSLFRFPPIKIFQLGVQRYVIKSDPPDKLRNPPN